MLQQTARMPETMWMIFYSYSNTAALVQKNLLNGHSLSSKQCSGECSFEMIKPQCCSCMHILLRLLLPACGFPVQDMSQAVKASTKICALTCAIARVHYLPPPTLGAASTKLGTEGAYDILETAASSFLTCRVRRWLCALPSYFTQQPLYLILYYWDLAPKMYW